MKLLIASSSFGKYGGIEAFVLALAVEAEKWPEFEVQVCVKLVPGHEADEKMMTAFESNLKCPVHFVKQGSPKMFRLIRWADVVHGQNTPPDTVFAAKVLRKKVVLTIHNWRPEKRDLRIRTWEIAGKIADRRWYNSNFVWNLCEPNGKLAGSECIPTVCHFPQVPVPAGERKGFLYISRWVENKGVEQLVKAYARVMPDDDKWPLTLVGDGPLRPRVEGLIRDLNIIGVHMPGFMLDDEKEKLIASAKWLVAPANTREPMGLTPIEARAVGVPAIVTRDGGLPEAAGARALVVEPDDIEMLADALRQAIAMSEAEYAERGEAGRASLATYLRPMEFYRDAYKEVLSEK